MMSAMKMLSGCAAEAFVGRWTPCLTFLLFCAAVVAFAAVSLKTEFVIFTCSNHEPRHAMATLDDMKCLPDCSQWRIAVVDR